MAKSFSMGGKTMVFDRGRYKQSDNVGSHSEGKGSGFLGKAAVQGASMGNAARKVVENAGKSAVSGGSQAGKATRNKMGELPKKSQVGKPTPGGAIPGSKEMLKKAEKSKTVPVMNQKSRNFA